MKRLDQNFDLIRQYQLASSVISIDDDSTSTSDPSFASFHSLVSSWNSFWVSCVIDFFFDNQPISNILLHNQFEKRKTSRSTRWFSFLSDHLHTFQPISSWVLILTIVSIVKLCVKHLDQKIYIFFFSLNFIDFWLDERLRNSTKSFWNVYLCRTAIDLHCHCRV